MTIYRHLTADYILKQKQERAENLRGSMENSGQEKDTVTFDQIKDGMVAAMGALKDERTLIRNAALEEAAKVCDELKAMAEDDNALPKSWMAADCAKAIRALKT